jgi:hypothetical protein
MENIINLLRDKIYHLQRFHDMNDVELVRFVEGKFENLESFYNSREAILDLVKCIDRLLEQAQLAEFPDQISRDHREQVSSTLAAKDRLVKKILGQDLQILSVLETAKSNIIRELAQLKTVRKAVGAYRSGAERPQLDEEA